MFIEKLDYSIDLKQVLLDTEEILKLQDWPDGPLGSNVVRNQIALSHRPGVSNPWLDGIGSLKDEQGNIIAKEEDFVVINEQVPAYTKSILEELSKREGVKFGRIRLMRLPSKMGLTIHKDFEYRYHLVLKTHPYALFGHAYGGEFPNENSKCYHIPADGHFYKVDTRMGHFVFNGSKEDRIHLVICAISES